MSRVATDGLYIELEYFSPEEYYAYVAEAEARLGYYYIDPGYIDADYYNDSPGVVSTLSCELTLVVGEVKEFDAALSSTASLSASAGKIVEATADIASAMAFSTTIFVTKYGDIDLYSLFTQSAGAERIRDNDITLDTLVSLSLQGDRTRAFDTALSASSTLSVTPSLTKYLSSTQNSTSTFTASATVTKDLTSTLAATVTLNASPDSLELFDAALSSTFTQTTSAYIANRRPRPYTTVGTPTISTDVKKFGSGSAYVTDQNYLLLPGSTDWKSWKTIDFWAKAGGITGGEVAYIYTQGWNPDTGTWYDSNNYFYVQIQSVALANNYYFEILQRINGTTTRFRSSYVVTTGWNHYRITRDTNGINMWIDGVKVTAPLSNTSVSTHPNIDTGVSIGNNIFGFTTGLYLDELYISKSILTSSGTSSFTVPTAEWRLTGTEQNNTILLSHYDGTFEDYTGAWEQGAAALTANNTLSADGNVTRSAEATLDSTATLTADALTISGVEATLASTTSVYANGGKLLEGAADITAQNNFALTATAVKDDSVYIETVAALSATATQYIGVVANLAANSSLTADPYVVEGGVIHISSTASINCQETYILNPIKSLVHFDNTQAGVPIDEFNNTWVGAVQTSNISNPVAFGDYAKFGNGAVYYDNVNVSPSGIQTHVVATERLELGVKDFSVDFRLYHGGEFISTYDIPVFQLINTSTVPATDIPIGIYLEKALNNEVNLRAHASADGDNFDLIAENIAHTFVHVAFSRTVANGKSTWRLFIDGVLADSHVENGITDFQWNYDALGYRLGGNWFDYADRSWFGGFIEEFRLITDANPYNSNFIPATIPYSKIFTFATVDPITADTTVYAQPTFIVDFESAQSAQFTSYIDADRTARLTSTMSAQTAADIFATKAISAQGQFSSTATFSCSPVKTASGQSTPTATATTSAIPHRIRDNDITALGTTTVNANAVIFAGSQISLSAAFTQSDIDIGRIRDYDIDVAAISIELVSAAKVGSALVTISTSSTLAASPTKDASVIVSGSVATTLETEVFRVAEASAEITANATFNLVPTKIKAVQAFLSSTSTASVIPSRTRPLSSDLSSTTVAQIQPNRTRDNSSVLNTTAGINATGLLVKFGVLNLTSQFDHVFILTKRVGGEAHISADGFILVAGRPIHIDTYYQLTVPAESRTIKVLEESRTFVVEEETRVLTI